jgi:hypothetical protein
LIVVTLLFKFGQLAIIKDLVAHLGVESILFV